MELEPGPFALIDPAIVPPARELHEFEELWARTVADVGNADVGAAAAEQALIEANETAAIDAEGRATIDAAAEQLAGARALLDDVRPAELLDEHDGQAAVIDATDREYEAEERGDPPPVPDWDPDSDEHPPERGPIPA